MASQDSAIASLDAVFKNPKMQHVLPSQFHTDGFIFAIAAAPEIPMPERWMPQLIRGGNDALLSEEVDHLADCFMGCLRQHLDAMRNEQISLPATCRWSSDASDTLPSDLSDWLQGVLQAHQFVEKDWQQVWSSSARNTADNADRLKRSLRLFSTLADVSLALQSRTPEQADMLQKNIPLLWRQLPEQLKDYVTLSGELAQSLPNQFETFTRENDAE